MKEPKHAKHCKRDIIKCGRCGRCFGLSTIRLWTLLLRETKRQRPRMSGKGREPPTGPGTKRMICSN